MKKIVFLCVMLLASVNMMAQIDLNDKNWDTVFIDDFSVNRYWDRHWDDSTGVTNYKPLWRCFQYSHWSSGVINPSEYFGDFSAYQPSNAVFSSDNTLKLKGQFQSQQNLNCSDITSDTTYYPAPWRKYCHGCGSKGYELFGIHYYSGMIESTDSLGYGYYEIRCKMPIKKGSHDAFWFWGVYGKYEEIDVFEHSFFCNNDIVKGFNSGIFYNPNGTNYQNDTINGVVTHGAYNYAHCSYHAPTTISTLDYYHTYGCLWLPERVAWYFDGKLYNEETDPSHIPQHPMWLKIQHYQDAGVILEHNNNNIVWWDGNDEMTIDYVKYYRLKTECNTDLVIRNLNTFQQFNKPSNYKVKRSITMGGQNNELVIPSNISFTLRAVSYIVIDGAFEIPQGTGMTLIIQNCPDCSQEGVFVQNYCPE